MKMLNRGFERADTGKNQNLRVNQSVLCYNEINKYVKDTDGRFLKVIRGSDPLELVSEFLDGVCEALHVSSAVVEEEETHDRRDGVGCRENCEILES